MKPRSARKADFAIVGLGKMGANLARQAAERGYTVAGFTKGAPPALRGARFLRADTLDALRELLNPPRKVFLYIPAGIAVDRVLAHLADVLDKGDLILDGGNSYWGDSIRRHARLKARGLRFLDLGTSGGMSGARHGACFMIGGARDAVAQIAPVLKKLAVPGGFVHAGGPGAGHFVKLVHNGIEFGMLQAIGEGLALLEASALKPPVADVLRCWRFGSVIRGWLMDLMEERLRADGLARVPPVIEDTGEVNWLVADAMELDVPVPVIAQSVMQLSASRDRRKDWARGIAMMRHGFGGHPYGRSQYLQRERRESRVGAYLAR